VVAYALAVVAFGLLIIMAGTLIVAWPVGKAIGTTYLIPPSSWSDGFLPIEIGHWIAGVVWVGVAVLFALGSPFTKKGSLLPTKVMGGLGMVLLIFCLVFPWLMVAVRSLFEGEEAGVTALGLIGGTASAGLGLLLRAMTKPLAKLAPRLGGVLLGLSVFLIAGKVATDAARGTADAPAGWWADPLWFWITLPVLATVYVTVDIQWISLREIYRSRLQQAFTFCTAADPSSDVDPSIPTGPQMEWTHPVMSQAPELVVCAAVHHSGFASQGTPAESFTISGTKVAQGRATVGTSSYLDGLPSSMERMKKVSSWMAVSGAAFSSRMGKFSFGTTNALMAALNIDLGIWLPNVSRVAVGHTRFKKVRLGYVIKEVLGLYDDVRDDYVFVADGGQWENLGLVELLRRGCETIICLDASGDPPGSYATLLEAFRIAKSELEGRFDVGLNELNANKSSVGFDAKSMVTLIPFVIGAAGGSQQRGMIFHSKLALADDLPNEIMAFARTDRHFPYYSTADQILDDQQFSYLVATGRHAGTLLAERVNAEVPDWVTAWHAAN
jgi:hypothetical protein